MIKNVKMMEMNLDEDILTSRLFWPVTLGEFVIFLQAQNFVFLLLERDVHHVKVVISGKQFPY